MSSELDLLQTKWRQEQLPHIDGIVYADGRIVLMHGVTECERGDYTTTISPIADTTLKSLLGYQEDAWVEIQISDQVQHDSRGLTYHCGGGAMGNEGFVACVDDNKDLVWAAFFTCSNPFWVLFPIHNNLLTAVSEYQSKWRFPTEAPEFVQV